MTVHKDGHNYSWKLMSFSRFLKLSGDDWSIQLGYKLFQSGMVLGKKEWWKGFLLARIGKILCWWLCLARVIVDGKVYLFTGILTSPCWILYIIHKLDLILCTFKASHFRSLVTLLITNTSYCLMLKFFKCILQVTLPWGKEYWGIDVDSKCGQTKVLYANSLVIFEATYTFLWLWLASG